MSRSRKQPIVKDGPRNHKKSQEYWKTVRRVTKSRVKYLQETIEEETLPEPQEIINDYDYSDYRFDMRFHDDGEYKQKAGRK